MNNFLCFVELQSPQTRGWQSIKNCPYPQTILLKLKSPTKRPPRLAKLHILSHQSKIPKKIEILIASNYKDDEDEILQFNHCQSIRRLGYVVLDTNERTDFQARELKTIDVSFEKACFVKLIIHKCYVNAFNPYKQVGIITINMLGKVDGEQGCGESSIQKGISYRKKDEIEDKMIQVSNLYDGDIKSSTRNDDPHFVKNTGFKPKLDSCIQARIDKLELKKRNMALSEDFENAARLKDVLSKVHESFSKFIDEDKEMKKAAFEENYPAASRAKVQRDEARKFAIEALVNAEKVALHFNEKTENTLNSSRNNLQHSPLSPTVLGHNQEIILEASNIKKTHQNHERINKCVSVRDNIEDDIEDDELSSESGSSIEIDKNNDAANEGNEHPLEGVSGFEDLPTPEDIDAIGGDIAPDIIQSIESILGRYRTCCIFSKNWSLREAVIMKTSMLVSTLVNNVGLKKCAPILCLILDRALKDRIVNIILSSFILLDDCITQFEMMQMPQREVFHLLGKTIIPKIMAKLGDNKRSVVESSEAILMSMSLTNCIGASYIGQISMKSMQTKDLKNGKAVSARFRFLQKLVEIFGDNVGKADQIFQFIKGKLKNQQSYLFMQ